MKFDAIIIGGGLSGLVCGLRLQKAGKNCLMVTFGQNVMYFSSGSFGLMSRDEEGIFAPSPFEAMKNLPPEHPYSKIGDVRKYAATIPQIFSEAGTPLHGDIDRNSVMMSALGVLRPAWMGLDTTTLLDPKDPKPGSKALIVNFDGFLDFNTSMIAEGLERHGVKARIVSLKIDEIKLLGRNPSEMRSVNIARVVSDIAVTQKIVSEIGKLIEDEDIVVLPAVFDLYNDLSVRLIRDSIKAKVIFLGTMPPSVPGIRSQNQLRKAFSEAGGTVLSGDEACRPVVEDNMVKRIYTTNLGETPLEADNFILATGSFFSKGLAATPEKIYETLFGLDVDYTEGRGTWYQKDFFGKQAYLGFGVRTDETFHPFIGGKKISNLYAIGSVLSGYNNVTEGSGAGVAMTTALFVADRIISGEK